MLNTLLCSLMISLSTLSPIPIAHEMSRDEFVTDVANCYSIAQEAEIKDINDETFIVKDYEGNDF